MRYFHTVCYQEVGTEESGGGASAAADDTAHKSSTAESPSMEELLEFAQDFIAELKRNQRPFWITEALEARIQAAYEEIAEDLLNEDDCFGADANLKDAQKKLQILREFTR